MMDASLPLFSSEPDPGSSFLDLLRAQAPHALPGAGLSGSPNNLEITHATTVVAIRNASGVVMAGDRRATAGYQIANRRIEKVFAADEHSGVAIAGAAGPSIEMVKLFQVQLEHYEKVEGETLSLEGKANQLGGLVRANLPAALQGFVVVPLFAGYDQQRNRGRVFSFDVTGGRYEEFDYATNGSGGVYARNWIKSQWKEDINEQDSVELALRALFAAADEDVGTGGPDLVRKIYPTVAVIDRNGFRSLEESEIAQRSQALLEGPERGGNE